jgi:hypothetical protein
MPVTFQKPKSGCVDSPARWLRFESRVSLKSGRNQDATDPVNALLNFSYAVAAEVGKLVSESVRSEAERVAASVRGSLLSIANVTYRVPRQAAQNERATPDGRQPASRKGKCCVCGEEVPGSRRYCDTHRREKFSEQWRKLWNEGKVKRAHGEDANRKRSESMRRAHALKGHAAG